MDSSKYIEEEFEELPLPPSLWNITPLKKIMWRNRGGSCNEETQENYIHIALKDNANSWIAIECPVHYTKLPDNFVDDYLDNHFQVEERSIYKDS